MSSENKTPNLQLNQWKGNECPKRIDFIEDNKKIDEAYKELKDSIKDGGKVSSVNGKIGDVVLKAEDIKMESGKTVGSQMVEINDDLVSYKNSMNNLGFSSQMKDLRAQSGNVNNLKDSGFYFVDASKMSNLPISSEDGYLEVFKLINSNLLQRFTRCRYKSIYQRQLVNNVWSDWVSINSNDISKGTAVLSNNDLWAEDLTMGIPIGNSKGKEHYRVIIRGRDASNQHISVMVEGKTGISGYYKAIGSIPVFPSLNVMERYTSVGIWYGQGNGDGYPAERLVNKNKPIIGFRLEANSMQVGCGVYQNTFISPLGVGNIIYNNLELIGIYIHGNELNFTFHNRSGKTLALDCDIHWEVW